MAIGAISLCVLNEVRVAVVQAEIGEAHVGLFPADHAVAIVAQDYNNQVHIQANCCLQLLAVHHESTVPAYRNHRAIWIHQVCGHSRW
ncbi:hypothetical protein D3C71_1988020 [compost metagenome]